MHELAVTERIVAVVVAHAARHAAKRIERVHLRVGALSDLETEWLQRYFDYLSRDTVAAGARLVVNRSPIVLRCLGCGATTEVARDEIGRASCAACAGSRLELVSGREYLIESMEVS